MGALSFKDCIAADIQQVFLNEDEFAGVHTVDGRPMRVILDDDGLQQRDAARGGVHSEGIYNTRRLIYLSKARPSTWTAASGMWSVRMRTPGC